MLAAPIVVGRGEAHEAHRDLLGEQVRASIRYADTAAWVSATAVARALAGVEDSIKGLRDRVAVVVVSDRGPAETMTVVADAARSGTSSPLRYPAANPGSLIGVTCIAFGFRGPTMNFTMPPVQGVPVGLTMATAWLGRGQAARVVLTAQFSGPASCMARSLLLAPQDLSGAEGMLSRADVDWIAGVAE